ncbi:putative ammonium transporter 3 [Eurytemora carolleeae]|uniref:putative ammonium transporter 3 n=1 Tax=Eurytemora carolleeae TaxID=1294199 RepID=UPI000C76D4A3|nr:putative ammonium transporter 3 [Eurytemora carolleeae]|eukprot:XP_023323583.1 putative ammonium transporter 3 [Eurytemora affinis]
MPVLRQEILKTNLTVLDPSEYIAANKTVPTFVDRSDDVAWMLACSLILFTMQTGLALMESGMCSLKNEVHLLMKNTAACCFGGLTYWAIGWSLSNGQGEYSTPYYGWGEAFYEPDWLDSASSERALFFFYQEGLSALSTSIVSGAMAERVNFRSFLVFSIFNTLVYALPAYWMWAPKGFLKELGAKDDAGCAVVHLCGGFSSLVATLYLGPRTGLAFSNETVVMGNPTFCCAGLFITWWGYLAMNSASTMGVEGTRWLQSAKATVLTMLSSFGGGSVALFMCYIFYGHVIPVGRIVNPIMGSLVAYTGITFLCTSFEAITIGSVAAALVFLAMLFLDDHHSIDDPCCTFIVHGLCGVWGMLAVGLFAAEDTISEGFSFNKYNGVFHGGFYLIGVQASKESAIFLVAIAQEATSEAPQAEIAAGRFDKDMLRGGEQRLKQTWEVSTWDMPLRKFLTLSKVL